MTIERIKDFKEIILPFFTNFLLKENYEGLGKSDAEEFEKDFNEILNLAEDTLESKWIPVSERLPEEKINPITNDFYEYQCTAKFGGFYDVRSYKFGRGHWWNDADLMDECVIAWMPLPGPYEEG